jgi:hypothetical protein
MTEQKNIANIGSGTGIPQPETTGDQGVGTLAVRSLFYYGLTRTR